MTHPFVPTFYGERGVMTEVGGKAQCHICGKVFHLLGLHVIKTHELTADEYRDEYGLNRSTGLVSDALAHKRRVAMVHRRQHDPRCVHPFPKGVNWTGRTQGKRRLETRRGLWITSEEGIAHRAAMIQGHRGVPLAAAVREKISAGVKASYASQPKQQKSCAYCSSKMLASPKRRYCRPLCKWRARHEREKQECRDLGQKMLPRHRMAEFKSIQSINSDDGTA